MSSGSFQLDELDAHTFPLQHRRYVLAPAPSPANPGRHPICLPVLLLAALLAPARDPDHPGLFACYSFLPFIMPLPVLLISLVVLFIILLISLPHIPSGNSAIGACSVGFLADS